MSAKPDGETNQPWQIRSAGPPVSVTPGPIVQLPTGYGEFIGQAWVEDATGTEHMSVSSLQPAEGIPLVRVHSECLTGDVFASYRCDCGEQLAKALQLICVQGGTLLYLRGHEGRGIGLANKLRAYALQETGADTVEANEQLGLPVDGRDYRAAAQILSGLGLHTIRLLSNNPQKLSLLSEYGIRVADMVPTDIPARIQNERYLRTKRDRMHHLLSDLSLATDDDQPVGEL